MQNLRTDAETIDAPQAPVFGKHPWIPYLLPMLVFMLAGWLEPRPPEKLPAPAEISPESAEHHDANKDSAGEDGFIAYKWYPLVYGLRIALTLMAIGVALPMYRTFPFRVNALSIVCGVVGVVVWVWLCSLGLEKQFIPKSIAGFLGIGSGRAAFDPLTELGPAPLALVSFLGVRFLGLALVVPLVEEFFLRGFVARFVQDTLWWKIPIGATGITARLAVVAYAAFSHPNEMVAAMVWFSMVTGLLMYTKNIWDAVAAHAVTNLLLGVYVVSTANWELW